MAALIFTYGSTKLHDFLSINLTLATSVMYIELTFGLRFVICNLG